MLNEDWNDHTAGGGVNDIVDNRYRVTSAISLHLFNGIAVFIIGIGYPFDLALKAIRLFVGICSEY